MTTTSAPSSWIPTSVPNRWWTSVAKMNTCLRLPCPASTHWWGMAMWGSLMLIPARLPPLPPLQFPSATRPYLKTHALRCKATASRWMIFRCMAVTRVPLCWAALTKHYHHVALTTMAAQFMPLDPLQRQAFRPNLHLSGIPLSAPTLQPPHPQWQTRAPWPSSPHFSPLAALH